MGWVPGGSHTSPEAGKVLAQTGAFTSAGVGVFVSFVVAWTGPAPPEILLRAGSNEQIFNPSQTPFVCPPIGAFYVGVGERVEIINRNAYVGDLYVSLLLSP